MGIDIYLEWDGITEEDKKQQYACGFSITGGKTGYLREAYHGEPYATQILVREAFEADNCRAEISAATMRERLTHVTEPAYGKTGGHQVAQAVGELIREVVEAHADEGYAFEGLVPAGSGQTSPMTVEEAVTLRARKLYNADETEIENTVQSFRDFVTLAEQKERETGKPCTVYASY